MAHAEPQPPDSPLAYAYNDGGLNNQKLALLGLLLEAKRTGRRLALPLLYNLDHAGGERGTVAFGDIYRRDLFAAMAERLGVEIVDAEPDAASRGWDFFAVGAKHIAIEVAGSRMTPDDPACAFFRALVPRLRDRVGLTPLRDWLHGRDPAPLVVQMRIETDWQFFSAVTLDPTVGKQEDYLPSFSNIVAKVVNTFGRDAAEIYVVCDEAALPVPREEIRRVAGDVFGVTLRWKSDLLPAEALAGLSVLERSILDFDTALQAGRFVGLSRSSFSNLVTFERYCLTEAPVRGHYIYNVPGPMVLERHDNGAYAIAGAAVARPA